MTLQIDDTAPDFEAMTTEGRIAFTRAPVREDDTHPWTDIACLILRLVFENCEAADHSERLDSGSICVWPINCAREFFRFW
jgi:hypothetical protein